MSLLAVNMRRTGLQLLRAGSQATYCKSSGDGIGKANMMDEFKSQQDDGMVGFQSMDHQFSRDSRSWSVDQRIDQREQSTEYNMESTVGLFAATGQERHERHDANHGYRAEYLSHVDQERLEVSGGSSVSLDSVMQSNVPTPFSPSADHQNPSHVNMPGGGGGRQAKYLYSSLHNIHPSKSYSTEASRKPVVHDDNTTSPGGEATVRDSEPAGNEDSQSRC